MSAQEPDFLKIEDAALAHLQTLTDPQADVEALAARRGDATTYVDQPAAWDTWLIDGDGRLDEVEDKAPILRLAELDVTHDELDGSADDYIQYWRIEMALAIGVLGTSQQNAERRFRDIRSVLVNHFMGEGSYLTFGKNGRTNSGLERATLVSGPWDTAMRGDQFIASGLMLLRIRCRWRQSAD